MTCRPSVADPSPHLPQPARQPAALPDRLRQFQRGRHAQVDRVRRWLLCRDQRNLHSRKYLVVPAGSAVVHSERQRVVPPKPVKPPCRPCSSSRRLFVPPAPPEQHLLAPSLPRVLSIRFDNHLPAAQTLVHSGRPLDWTPKCTPPVLGRARHAALPPRPSRRAAPPSRPSRSLRALRCLVFDCVRPARPADTRSAAASTRRSCPALPGFSGDYPGRPGVQDGATSSASVAE